jgi:hypothetical protein
MPFRSFRNAGSHFDTKRSVRFTAEKRRFTGLQLGNGSQLVVGPEGSLIRFVSNIRRRKIAPPFDQQILIRAASQSAPVTRLI